MSVGLNFKRWESPLGKTRQGSHAVKFWNKVVYCAFFISENKKWIISSEWKITDIFVLPTTDNDCRQIKFKDPIPNMALKNHAIKSVEVPNEGSCRVMCYMEPNCVSINVGPVAGGSQKCELNNATEENHAPFLLVNNPGYAYLAIEVTFHILMKLRW